MKQEQKDLIFWSQGDQYCFSSKLFEAIAKADKNNLQKISKVFPEYVDEFLNYRQGGDIYINDLKRGRI